MRKLAFTVCTFLIHNKYRMTAESTKAVSMEYKGTHQQKYILAVIQLHYRFSGFLQ